MLTYSRPAVTQNVRTGAIRFIRLASSTGQVDSEAASAINQAFEAKDCVESKDQLKRDNNQPLKESKIRSDFEVKTAKRSESEKKKYGFQDVRPVANTEGINNSNLFLDILLNNSRSLISPILSRDQGFNLKGTKKRKNPSVLENLEQYRKVKDSNKTKNYNAYFTKKKSFMPFDSVFTNTFMNTQQHNLELFNFPLNYLNQLKPFHCSNRPGDEAYRDDSLIVRKLEIEEKEVAERALRLQRYSKDMKFYTSLPHLQKAPSKVKPLHIDDFEEFFGFK